MKLGKATGFGEIPAEVLRNGTCIDLLFKIVSYCFDKGVVPNHCFKGIINPILKGNTNPIEPLDYRPITLLSIPCKIYAHILNTRLMKWVEEKKILCEEQNGFRSQRSCLDHVYTLYSVLNNRKLSKKTIICLLCGR